MSKKYTGMSDLQVACRSNCQHFLQIRSLYVHNSASVEVLEAFTGQWEAAIRIIRGLEPQCASRAYCVGRACLRHFETHYFELTM